MEDIRKCKKRGRRGLSWTSARQASSGQDGRAAGGDATDCAGVGFGSSGGRFSARGGRWRL